MRPHAIPAMPNAHSHAFQVGLRGVAERTGPTDFWGWREAMFALAGSLTPETIRAGSERLYREARAAGYGAVGEFHYVHHQPDGTPYDDPNAMAKAVAEAARGAGVEIVLLPAAYHRGGPRRFRDPDVETFLARVDDLRAWASRATGVRVGVAAHSVRAVPAGWLEAIAAYADEHGLVRHVHAAEQRRELEECEAEHGCSPIELLRRTGFLGPGASVIHGIHVGDEDIARLADSRTIVVTCPTTEGNLGDGTLPALRYRDAGVRLALGSDSQVRVDPFEEARELETLARREQEGRTALLAHHDDLWGELARNGRAALGLPEDGAGQARVDRDHPQLAGVPDEDVGRALVTCASAAVVVP